MSCCDTEGCLTTPTSDGAIVLPGTNDHTTPWKFYNHLIAEIPEDILVTDCCLGSHWSYVEAECGTGVSYTLGGGGKGVYDGVLSGLPLRNVAELAKSWNFHEATIGVAALNAWYSQEDKILALGGKIDDGKGERGHARPGTSGQDLFNGHYPTDPFIGLRKDYTGKMVTVIGHFPGVDEMAEICDLTVLERNPRSSIDTPDPACEYLLPSQDFVFSTGVTIINKTAPRIFDLAKNATLVLVGPSVIPSEFLFSWGVDILAGRIVTDPELIKVGVKQGAGFKGALRMFSLASNRCS